MNLIIVSSSDKQLFFLETERLENDTLVFF
jgi:hypothetical protein